MPWAGYTTCPKRVYLSKDAEFGMRNTLVFAEYTDDAALDSDVGGGYEDGSHLGVCRLQTDFAGSFAIETLERGFFPADEGHDDISAVGHLGLLADHEIAVHDVIFDHGVTFHLKHKRISSAREITERDGFPFFDSFEWAACSDAPY